MPDVSDDILRKAQRLAAVTFENGYHPNEVEFAAVKLKALLAEHQLSIADLKDGTLGEDVEHEWMGLKDDRDFDKKWRRSVIYYAGQIGHAFDCRVVFQGQARIAFVGMESDVKVAKFFFETTWQPIIDVGCQSGRLLRKTGQHLVSYYDHFLMGAGIAVRRRLKPPQPTPEQAATSALVPLKDRQIEKFMKDRFGKVSESKYRARARDGFADGVKYGNSMDLQRGIEGANSRPRAALGG